MFIVAVINLDNSQSTFWLLPIEIQPADTFKDNPTLGRLAKRKSKTAFSAF